MFSVCFSGVSWPGFLSIFHICVYWMSFIIVFLSLFGSCVSCLCYLDMFPWCVLAVWSNLFSGCISCLYMKWQGLLVLLPGCISRQCFLVVFPNCVSWLCFLDMSPVSVLSVESAMFCILSSASGSLIVC